MLKNVRLIEYMSVLTDIGQALNNYEVEKNCVLESIEAELKNIGGNSNLKVMVEDITNIVEDNAFLVGMYYGAQLVTLINVPTVLPDEY